MKPHNTRHTEAAQIREALRAMELDSCTSAESRRATVNAHGSADFSRNAPASIARAESSLSLGDYCADRR